MIEGKFYDRTTPVCSEDRTAVVSVVKTELYVCTQRVSALNTHTHLKDCKAE